MCFVSLFSVFGWSSVIKYSSKRKGNKDTNMYISCILLRNAGINNSKRWLEFGLTDHLNQRTVYN